MSTLPRTRKPPTGKASLWPTPSRPKSPPGRPVPCPRSGSGGTSSWQRRMPWAKRARSWRRLLGPETRKRSWLGSGKSVRPVAVVTTFSASRMSDLRLRRVNFLRGALVASLLALPVSSLAQQESIGGSSQPSAIERGEYIFRATGGCGWHTDYANGGALLAGGRAIETPFGTIYGTNITPDPETGIGNWSDEDFLRAMTEGLGPAGTIFYPAFPYTAFPKMTRQDVFDLTATLSS